MPVSADAARSSDPGAAGEDEAAVRVLVRFVAAIIAVVLAAALGLLVHRTTTGDDAGPAAVSTDSTPSSPGDPAVVSLPHTLGPLAGTDVGPYIETRRVALASADGPHAAVVSFSAYATEAEARAALRSVSVRALMVAAPGGDPAIAHGSLNEWAQQTRADVEDQQHQFEQLLASKSVTDAEFVEQYRQEVARLARLRRSIDPNGRIVFAAVVVGEAAALRSVAASPSVRLVDVAPGAAVPDDPGVRGLRPEETQKAGDPAVRPTG